MEFKNIEYRECENKWYIIKDLEETKILDEVTKNKDNGYYIGYVYIDHYAGLSMFLVGKCNIENGLVKFLTPVDKLSESSFALTNNIIESFDNFRVYDINNYSFYGETKEIIEEFIYNEFYKEIENKHPFILEYRKDVNEDINREKNYPDSICFLLKKEGCENELCWARVEGYHKEDKEIRAVLLENPFDEKFGLSKGDVVGLVRKPNIFDGYIAVTGYKKDRKFNI